MNRSATIVAAAVLAGVASATPAFGRDRELECPAMPTTNDIERSRAGGLSFQFGGVGLSGNRSRSRAETDVMMRQGGFRDWSAATVLSHSCQLNRRLYRNDLRRQRDEFIALRDRLLAGRSTDSGQGRQTTTRSGDTSRGWTFAQMWEPLATYRYMPQAALLAGLTEGTAQVDCRISQERGVDDCYLLSESPRGYGFGVAAGRYLGALRLKNELLGFPWSERRIQLTVTIATNM